MEDLHKIAIDAARDLLILMLNDGDWCTARQVGGALEILVNSQKSRRPIMQEERVDECASTVAGPTGSLKRREL